MSLGTRIMWCLRRSARLYINVSKRCVAVGAGCRTRSHYRLYSSSPAACKSNYDSLVERKLYLETAFGSEAGRACVTSVVVTNAGKDVEITWDDGEIARYNSIWLRHNCHCPSCRLSTNQSIVNIRDLDLRATIALAEKDGEKVIKVVWKDEPDHVGVFPVPFLKYYSYSDRALAEKDKLQNMFFNEEPILPQVEYSDVMNTDEGVYRWLKGLTDYGIAIVKNVPLEEMQCKKVAERIAPCQSTIYGETFDVKDKPRPSNFAYTPLKLGLHMDQVMYESGPGIQLLHCIRFDKEVTGGGSVFVDMYHVADKMRKDHPREFNDLVRIPAVWETIHYDRDIPVHMSYKRPHIQLNSDGQVVGLTWHPSLFGPIQTKEADIEPYYKAYKLLATLIDTFPVQYRFKLQEGDLISFNNRRMLHGRDEFNPNSGHRFLQGTYIQIDEFKSQAQVFNNRFGDGVRVRRVGNNDWS